MRDVEDTLLDINELVSFLQEKKNTYISKEGEAFLDGLRFADYEFRFVSKEKYDRVVEELKREKSKKKSLF